MMLWSRLRSWMRVTLLPSRMESEMDTELRFHLEAYSSTESSRPTRSPSLV